MTKKRTLWMLLVMLLLLPLISACGSEGGQPTESAASEEEETGTEESFEEENETGSEAAETTGEQQTENAGRIISISMAEMEEKLESGEPFLVSFVTIYCPYCQDLHSMLAEYIKDHAITMYQVILDYEETPESENREKIVSYFSEFHTVPGVFYVEDQEHYSYLDTYHLGVGMDVFDEWVQENDIENGN